MDVESILDLMPKPDKEDGIVWTPRIIAKKMIDNLPKEVWNHNTKFLDPVCKSGIFLEEILNRLMELDYWKEKYTNIYERRIKIVNKQLFGIAEDKISKAVADRVLYCQLVDNSNIRYIENYRRIVVNNKLADIIDKEFNRMKFDVIIGNPPYQQSNGGGGRTESTDPLYNKFIEQLIKLDINYMSMIIPSRWCSTDKTALNEFRRNFIESRHLVGLHIIENSERMFEYVIIAGGVMYFLYDKNRVENLVKVSNYAYKDNELKDVSISKRDIKKYTCKDSHGNKIYIVLTDNKADSVIDKILNTCSINIEEKMYKRNVFGVSSDFFDKEKYSEINPIKVMLGTGVTYTNKTMIKKEEIVDKYKTVVGKVSVFSGMPNADGSYTILGKPKVLEPSEVCSDSYLVLSCFDTKEEAINLSKYMKTKLVRFLIKVTMSGMNLSPKNFTFVPYLDFTKEWTDEKLYKKFCLTDDEIEYIEQKIRTMD